MIRYLCLLLCLATPLTAQDFTGLARVDTAQTRLRDEGRDLVIDLHLSQPIPYRVFSVDNPRRLVLDFREVDWTGVIADQILQADTVGGLRFGALRSGWSRMVVDLNGPMEVTAAGMSVDQGAGLAHLQVRLVPTDADSFAANAGAPDSPAWESLTPSLPPAPEDDGPLVVVIDPGHGGIDPGAEREGLKEADLMLQLSIEVADALNRSGTVRAILTRESDVFVSLNERMTIARAAGADLLISLHADALEEDEAKGASVYTLNAAGADQAAARMAERHERGDLLAGLDLSGTDDRVATVLMDLARTETGPRGDRFADLLVNAMRDNGQRVNSKPRREARLAVLNAADFASVLVEVGFLSNTRDRDALRTVQGRAPMVNAIISAVQTWAVDEAMQDALIRQ